MYTLSFKILNFWQSFNMAVMTAFSRQILLKHIRSQFQVIWKRMGTELVYDRFCSEIVRKYRGFTQGTFPELHTKYKNVTFVL